MTKTELSELAQVARPTIERWATGRRKPLPAPVNAVADVLGIDREHALRLAGVIPGSDAEEAVRRAGVPPHIVAEMARTLREEVEPEKWDEFLAAVMRAARGEPQPPPTGPGAKTPPRGTQKTG